MLQSIQCVHRSNFQCVAFRFVVEPMCGILIGEHPASVVGVFFTQACSAGEASGQRLDILSVKTLP